ncbi:MAG: helix-turn-helix domain-containing protein, partial [Planctomycetota bacterium]
DRLRTEIALLSEELAIKDARWSRVPARRRPHYHPIQRLRVLKLRAARGWSVAQTGQRFLVTEETVSSWIQRVDEGGERALVQDESRGRGRHDLLCAAACDN